MSTRFVTIEKFRKHPYRWIFKLRDNDNTVILTDRRGSPWIKIVSVNDDLTDREP